MEHRILFYYDWEHGGEIGHFGEPCKLFRKISRRKKTTNVYNLDRFGETDKKLDYIALNHIDQKDERQSVDKAYTMLKPGAMLVIPKDIISGELWSWIATERTWHPCQFGAYCVIFKENEAVLPYKDKHKGERVWIIGNGPSLKDINLDLIKDEPAIAMNRINLLYPDTKWRPKYYIYCSDNVDHPKWGKDWQSSVDEIAADPKTTSFVWTKYGHAVKGDSKPVWLERFTEEDVTKPFNFSENASQWMSKSGTSINVALQLAHYMGFKQMIFVGIDLNWQTSDSIGGDPNHFDKSYQANIPDGEEERRRMLITHYNAKMALQKHGVEMYNATPSSFVDTYPFVRYETITKDKSYSAPHHDEDHPDSHALRDMVTTYWRRNGLIEQRRFKFFFLTYMLDASIKLAKKILGPVKRKIIKPKNS